MSEWISIENGMPTDLERVDILINKQRRVVDCTYMNNAFWYHGFPDEYWTEVKNNVTHWMYLPEPPK